MICECIVCVLDGMYEGVDSSDGRHAGWAHEILLVEMSWSFVDVDGGGVSMPEGSCAGSAQSDVLLS